VANGVCVHCGQQHPLGTTFCPQTGRPIPAAPAAPPPPQAGTPYGQPPPSAQQPPYAQQPSPNWNAPPGNNFSAPAGSPPAKPIGILLNEAVQMYTKNWVALFLTCAVLFLPIAVARSFATSLILAPTIVATDTLARHSEDLSRRLQENARRSMEAANDPKKRAEIAKEQAKLAEDVRRDLTATSAVAVGSLMALFLGLVAALVTTFILFAIVLPLTSGAVTVTVADRLLGGTAGPDTAWKVLLSRLGQLLSAGLLSGVFVLFGTIACILPGIVLGFLFTFVTPVVMLEGKGGMTAVKRSVELVKFDWAYVLIIAIVFAFLKLFASFAAHIVIPRSAPFLGELTSDLILLFLLPFPIIGTVLAYLDIRRRKEGFQGEQLRVGLASLRGA
jgi:hypothetical protein